jgi:hypothetical protein
MYDAYAYSQTRVQHACTRLTTAGLRPRARSAVPRALSAAVHVHCPTMVVPGRPRGAAFGPCRVERLRWSLRCPWELQSNAEAPLDHDVRLPSCRCWRGRQRQCAQGHTRVDGGARSGRAHQGDFSWVRLPLRLGMSYITSTRELPSLAATITATYTHADVFACYG